MESRCRRPVVDPPRSRSRSFMMYSVERNSFCSLDDVPRHFGMGTIHLEPDVEADVLDWRAVNRALLPSSALPPNDARPFPPLRESRAAPDLVSGCFCFPHTISSSGTPIL